MRRDWPTLTTRYVENLVSVYALASDAEIRNGRSWYPAARRYAQSLARKHSVSLEVAAGIIAALSPGSEWTRNKESADEFLTTYGKCSTCDLESLRLSLHLTTYGIKPLMKAWAILAGAPVEQTLSGDKTTTFYRCIMDPKQTRNVCIDGHAKSAAQGIRRGNHDGRSGVGGVQHNEYPHLESAFLAAAQVAELLPGTFQAVIWLVWKRLPVGYRVESILEVSA